MSRPDDVLDAIRSDIERIRSDQKWCFFDGYQPRGANPDRVTGVEARDVIGRDDVVVSENVRLDIGVGDSHSRTAYLLAARLITYLEFRLYGVVWSLGPHPQPAAIVVDTTTTLETRDAVLHKSTIRLNIIASEWDGAGRWNQKAAHKHLDAANVNPPSARAAADRAVRLLSRALSRGNAEGLATGEPMCLNCGIRRAEDKAGGRCWTCATWRVRNRGAERPRSLDHDELAAPIAAAARRRARDEGFGAS